MSIWLWFYVVGLFVAMAYSVWIFSDENKRITFGNIIAAFCLSLLSWITLLALWVGQNIKNAVEESEKRDVMDDEDDFYNNDYDGF